jgi:hypothetical protein
VGEPAVKRPKIMIACCHCEFQSNREVKLLVDLQELDARGKGGNFRLHIEALRRTHARRPSFIEELRKAGL